MLYERILSRLTGVPLLLEESKLITIANNIIVPISIGSKPARLDSGSMPIGHTLDNETQQVIEDRSVGVIDISGSLVAKNATGDSGTISYELIGAQTRSYLKQGKRTICYAIHSYGGEADGCFGLSRYISSLKAQGIRTIAIIDGPACSAGYLLASGCSEIWATDASMLGSIAVLACLMSQAEADKANGEQYKIIRSKSEKALGSPHEPISEQAITSVEERIKTLDGIMNRTIHDNRSKLSIQTILDLNGRTVLGEEALQLNLIDKLVPSFNMALDGLTLSKPTKSNISISSKGATMTLEEAQAQIIEQQKTIADLNGKLALATASATNAERTRVTTILKGKVEFGLTDAMILPHVEGGMASEHSIAIMEGIKQGLQMNNASPTGTTLGSTVNTHVRAPDVTAKTVIDEFNSAVSANPFDVWAKGIDHTKA